MRVILQESVENLGLIGDVVVVKDGFARNFLFPRGKAVLATEGEIKKFESRRDKIAKAKALELEEAKKTGEKLAKIALTKAVKVSDEGQLYGSVGVSDVAELLGKAGYEIEKKQVLLPEPIRALGAYTIPIRIHPEVTVDIALTVEKEEEK
ncbi:MAG: 50S ribosomal protein L9 [Candidatus Hydrogenedentota bacterium]